MDASYKKDFGTASEEVETFAWRDNVFISFCQQGGLPVALALFVARDVSAYTVLYIKRGQREAVVEVFAMWDSLAGRLPVGGRVAGSAAVLCGKYSSTLRKVRFGTAHGALAFSAFSGFAVRTEKLFFSFRQFFFPWRLDFFHRSDGWADCLFVRVGSRSGAKVQRRAPFSPAFLNFLIKNNRVSLEGLKICFTAAFLVVWRSFPTFTELFRLKKKLPENLVGTVKVPTFALAFGKDARRDVPERGQERVH